MGKGSVVVRDREEVYALSKESDGLFMKDVMANKKFF